MDFSGILGPAHHDPGMADHRDLETSDLTLSRNPVINMEWNPLVRSQPPQEDPVGFPAKTKSLRKLGDYCWKRYPWRHHRARGFLRVRASHTDVHELQ